MEKIVNLDKQGRIYLPEELRKYFQLKAFIAKIQEDGIYLKPIDDDPIEALSKLGKKLTKSVQQLKKEARSEIEENAIKKIRRH